ncbi:hypothetical protein A2Z67_03955 [Candidatus Woesebacteria bacterium RBG_13_36_22]|uniref:O-antigen ligase-related domain-containing protein n=2 Tax=Candidatus Woeseibacteriota TaxID=1752722 RepID=A0A1F7X6Y7_9BACT|nr:MAG: hypothetical protein A2Z67_03955 [Candidatus Woesebacteria bacterium RBG_13_36_22]
MPKLMQKLLKIFEKTISFLILAIIMFVPLYMKFPSTNIPGTSVAIRLEDFLIFITLFLWFIYLILSGKIKSMFKDKLNQVILTFFFIGALSVFTAIFVSHSVIPLIGILHYLRRVEMLLLLPLGIWAARNIKGSIYFYLFVVSIVILLVNLYALGQRLLGFPSISTINAELAKGLIRFLTPADRVNSTFSGHYDLAIFLMMGISVISGIIFYFIDSKNRFKYPINIKILGLILLVALSLVVLIMTAARLSFVATILAVFLALILMKKKKVLLATFFISLLVLIYPTQLRDRLFATVTVNIQRDWKSYFAVSEDQAKRSRLNIPTLPSVGKKTETIGADAPDIAPGEPVNTTDLGVYRSMDIRTKVEWPRAIRAFIENPLLGTGYSSLGLATDNDFLRSLGEVGLLGTISFIFIFIILIRKYIQVFRKSSGFVRYLAVGMLAMTFAVLLNSTFIDVFEASKVAFIFWIFNGLVFGFMLDKNNVSYD